MVKLRQDLNRFPLESIFKEFFKNVFKRLYLIILSCFIFYLVGCVDQVAINNSADVVYIKTNI